MMTPLNTSEALHMPPQHKFEATRILGSKQASSSLLEIKSNHLHVPPSLVTSPRIGFWHPCDIYARKSRPHSLNNIDRADRVLVHLILGCNSMAKLVTRCRQDSGWIPIEPCCSALIASEESLYSYVSMLQRKELPPGLSTSLTPTPNVTTRANEIPVAPCAAPRLLSHLRLALSINPINCSTARLRNTVLVLPQHLSQTTIFPDYSSSDFVLLSLIVIALFICVYFVISFTLQKTFY